MKRASLSRFGSAALIAGLLASLAVAAPNYNAQHAAPRSVFHVLPDTLPEPSLSATLELRSNGEWLLKLDTQGFVFTNLCVSDAAALPIGHAHIMLDGVKVASAFHPVASLGMLPPGRYQITVVLRGQDHRALLGANGLIQTEIDLVVPKSL